VSNSKESDENVNEERKKRLNSYCKYNNVQRISYEERRGNSTTAHQYNKETIKAMNRGPPFLSMCICPILGTRM
jgi:hypothetical protein